MPLVVRPSAPRLARLALAAALLGAAGCAGSRAPAAGDGTLTETGRARSQRGTFDLISRAEIESRAWANAHDMISTLRPQWVRERPPDSINGTTPVQTYLDNTRLRGIAALAEISTAGIVAAEFVDGVEAGARWGLGHGMGAIVLRTRPAR